MNSDPEQELEDARERYFWGRLVHTLGASLVFLSVLAVLWIVTVFLGWQRYLLLCFLGLLAGISVAAAVAGSRRSRAMTGLVIGGVTLPLLAAYLGAVAARSPEAFSANSASLFPFLVHGTVAFLASLWLSSLWRQRPTRPLPGAPRAEEPAPHSEGAPP